MTEKLISLGYDEAKELLRFLLDSMKHESTWKTRTDYYESMRLTATYRGEDSDSLRVNIVHLGG